MTEWHLLRRYLFDPVLHDVPRSQWPALPRRNARVWLAYGEWGGSMEYAPATYLSDSESESFVIFDGARPEHRFRAPDFQDELGFKRHRVFAWAEFTPVDVNEPLSVGIDRAEPEAEKPLPVRQIRRGG